MDEVKDGLYMFYVKKGEIYPIVLNDEGWEKLQFLGNMIAGDPIKVLDKPMGKVERLTKGEIGWK